MYSARGGGIVGGCCKRTRVKEGGTLLNGTRCPHNVQKKKIPEHLNTKVLIIEPCHSLGAGFAGIT